MQERGMGIKNTRTAEKIKETGETNNANCTKTNTRYIFILIKKRKETKRKNVRKRMTI